MSISGRLVEQVTRIRRATPADAAALAGLRYEFRAALGQPAEPREPFLARCREWMAERLADGRGWRCWMAQHGAGGSVGTAWLQLIEKLPNPVGEPEIHGYVTSLYVQPDRRGAGLGSSLLAAALHECEVLNVDTVILWPTPKSRPLYQRHGFAAGEDLLERRLARPRPPELI